MCGLALIISLSKRALNVGFPESTTSKRKEQNKIVAATFFFSYCVAVLCFLFFPCKYLLGEVLAFILRSLPVSLFLE
ncbi:hypothetical protein RchiOBHm_Chr2g0140291 [Rosa chinensis]|uniref:Uncharacterized protein n=1 Tax=Rosa chinensis TaxID=74649 RepID=A0A2P6RXE6_ROSCH|nr:hypothetical protein RchiOBHm_Chr2g0140291 [Rosa chinensis]